MKNNPYLPEIAMVSRIIQETPNIKTFQVVLQDEEKRRAFCFQPGQVAQLSVFGAGEATFVINSSPLEPECLQFTIMEVGEVTTAIHELSEGDHIGIRAPLGNYFPYENMKGKNILLVGGGIGIAPLRPLLLFILAHREEYREIKVIYGAKTPSDFCFGADLREWDSREDMDLILTVDKEFPGWVGRVGLVPAILSKESPSVEKTIAVTCGPPIMIKFTLLELAKLGFGDDQIITTLERRMKCGIGLCGRCNIGPKYVCVDGPVFTLRQLNQLPEGI